ncbi:MAG TPA: phosphotransferase, partial [Acidimicrobiales bacterium]|nr:phosphotransferase [Acidimicrobiales bacterium]
MPPLIDDPERMTPEWMTAVMRAAGVLASGRVTGLDGETIGTGQVGCNVRYRLTYEGGSGPDSLVVKFASRDPVSQQAGVQTLTYETEVAFYRDVAATVDVARPRAFYAAVEPGTPRVAIVLEDLAPAVQGDQIAGCSPDQARPVVVEAARLHGPRWGDPTLHDLPWLAGRSGADGCAGAFFAMLYSGFVDRYRDRLADITLRQCEILAEGVDRMGAHQQAALTVCHGDFRLDNMLFGPPGSDRPVVIVDWQTVRLGVGT